MSAIPIQIPRWISIMRWVVLIFYSFMLITVLPGYWYLFHSGISLPPEVREMLARTPQWLMLVSVMGVVMSFVAATSLWHSRLWKIARVAWFLNWVVTTVVNWIPKYWDSYQGGSYFLGLLFGYCLLSVAVIVSDRLVILSTTARS